MAEHQDRIDQLNQKLSKSFKTNKKVLLKS